MTDKPQVKDRVRIAVVGVGHLGKHHARLLNELPEAELVGVVDSHAENAREVAAKLGCGVFADPAELPGKVDAVTVAVPTDYHRRVAGPLLEAGLDVLVEKPLTPTVSEGRELVEIAKKHGRILQVGHVERFNAALQAVQDLGESARYIESHRLAPFTFRSTDIGVVLDLMIHDLDLVLSLIQSPIKSVDAFGGSVFTPAEDMASAIIKFENSAVAHLTANRVAIKPMRKMRIFSPAGYVSLDFHESKGLAVRKGEGWDLGKFDLSNFDRTKVPDMWEFVFKGLLQMQAVQLDEGNPLREQLAAFLKSVRDRSRPLVSGEDGLAAVEAAELVLAAIDKNRWR